MENKKCFKGLSVPCPSGVNELTTSGFSNQDVSVLMADKAGTKEFATEKNTKAPEGTTTGAGVGGTVGGTIGLLAGIGAIAIPGVGPLIAAGSDYGHPSWHGDRGSGRWGRRRSGRDGNSGIRSKAL